MHLDSGLRLVVLVVRHIVLLSYELDVPLDPYFEELDELRPCCVQPLHERSLQIVPLRPVSAIHQSLQALHVLVAESGFEVSLVLQ